MRSSYTILLPGIIATSSASPIPYAQSLLILARRQSSAPSESAFQAVQNWQQDTATVSNFLNIATSLSGAAFTSAATTALAAEKNELVHKAALDNNPFVGNNPAVNLASTVLADDGTFQAVVNLLQDMVTNGPSVAVRDVNAIDANRCKNVLPSIDVYFAAAGTELQSVRPDACGQFGQTQVVTAETSEASEAVGPGGMTDDDDADEDAGGPFGPLE